MDSDSDSYYEENSSEAGEEVAGPLHVSLAINLEESPESPPPRSPSPLLPPHPIPVGELSPVWELPDDGTNFLNFFTRADVLELKQGAETTRNRRNDEGYVVEEPLLAQNFVAFLIEYHSTQLEIKFLRIAAEPLFAQMLAYVAGYACLTSHNNRIFRQGFETWSVEVKRAFAVVGGVGQLPRKRVSCSALSVLRALSALGGLYIVLCHHVLYGFLLSSCTTNKNIFGFLQ